MHKKVVKSQSLHTKNQYVIFFQLPPRNSSRVKIIHALNSVLLIFSDLTLFALFSVIGTNIG
jgi:hypothetical protein